MPTVTMPGLVVMGLGALARPPINVGAAFREWLLANGHLAATHCAGCAAYYTTAMPTARGTSSTSAATNRMS